MALFAAIFLVMGVIGWWLAIETQGDLTRARNALIIQQQSARDVEFGLRGELREVRARLMFASADKERQ